MLQRTAGHVVDVPGPHFVDILHVEVVSQELVFERTMAVVDVRLKFWSTALSRFFSELSLDCTGPIRDDIHTLVTERPVLRLYHAMCNRALHLPVNRMMRAVPFGGEG